MRSTGAPPAGESKEKARENYSFSLSHVLSSAHWYLT